METSTVKLKKNLVEGFNYNFIELDKTIYQLDDLLRFYSQLLSRMWVNNVIMINLLWKTLER